MKYEITLQNKNAMIIFSDDMNIEDLELIQNMLIKAIDNRKKELKRMCANNLGMDDEIKNMYPPLSMRTQNILLRANYNTIGDVLGSTLTELERVRNMGKKSMDEIKERFSKYGTFKGQEDEL